MRELVLVGGGHAHLQALRCLMRRPPAARVRLVSDQPTAVYSGMVPGMLERRYEAGAATIDLASFAARAGVAFTCGRVVEVGAREVRTAEGDRLPFDVLSLDVGSGPARTAEAGSVVVPARPGMALLDTFEGLPTPPAHLAVVGGGAAGVEIACTLAAGRRARRITLWERGDRLLPGLPLGLARSVERVAARRGVDLRLGTAFGPQATGPERERFDLVIQATGATAPVLGRESGLPVDGEGYLRVDASLRVEGTDNVFAVGDCATLTHAPDTPKAGVFAVRQGPVLARNLCAFLEARELSPYHPQRRALVLLNLGNGIGAGAWGHAHVTGSSMMRLKDWIDQRWIRRFR